MAALVNDRWRGAFPVAELGRYRYTIAGLGRSLQNLVARPGQARRGRPGCHGRSADRRRAGRGGPSARRRRSTPARLGRMPRRCAPAAQMAHSRRSRAELAELMRSPRRAACSPPPTRKSWRSRSTASARASAPGTSCSRARCAPEPGQHGTFKDVEARLPYVAAMGFDVLYLPPIHPIGRSLPQRANNTTERRARRPRQPMGDRRGRGRAQGHPSRSLARWRISAAWCAARASMASRSRWISPSSARPTTPM